MTRSVYTLVTGGPSTGRGGDIPITGGPSTDRGGGKPSGDQASSRSKDSRYLEESKPESLKSSVIEPRLASLEKYYKIL